MIAADIDDEIARSRLPDGDLGAPMSAGFLLFLAGWVGAEPGTLDVVLAKTDGSGATPTEVWAA